MELQGVHPTLLVLQNSADGSVGVDLNFIYRQSFCEGEVGVCVSPNVVGMIDE
jgi:hypothetical protein